MPAYAYPIVIKREKQEVKDQREITLESRLFTLQDLRNHVAEGEMFSIDKMEGYFGDAIILTVYKTRLETDEELRARVESEEKYMEEYNKRHKK